MLVTVISTGTERAYYLRLPNAQVKLPFRPGYTGAGVVVRVGADVTDFVVGDLVAVRGVGHASLATVPATAVFPIPSGVAPEDAALVELGVIAGQGVRRAAIEHGDDVCVVGAGIIGSLAQRLAVAGGAGEITAVARSRDREGVARAGGASRFLVTGVDDEAIAALAARVVIEAAGDPAAVSLALAACGDRGRVVLLGSQRGVTRDFDVMTIRRRRLTVVGAHVATLDVEAERTAEDMRRREAEAFLRALSSGAITVSDLVDVVADPREAGAFYRDLGVGRPMLGARFDWTALGDDAVSPARHFRFPDVTGKGMTFDERPLPLGTRPRAAFRNDELFAGASGMLRVALLGCGDIGVHNAAAVAQAPNARLVACYDPLRALAEEIAADHDATVPESVEALLARSDVDAVFISVPHHWHAPLAIQAAEAGKHLIVEKPPANDLASAVAMFRAAEEAGVAISVCFPNRYQPTVVEARRLVRSGALGTFGGMMLVAVLEKAPSYWHGGFLGRAYSDWRLNRQQAGGGVLIMNLCHEIDILQSILDVPVESVQAVSAPGWDGPADIEDSISIAVRYANGAVGSVFGSASVPGRREGGTEVLIWGSDGCLALEPHAQVYTLRAIDSTQPGRWQSLEPKARPSAGLTRAMYVSRFATAVTCGAPVDVPPADALAVQAFIEAAYRSSDVAGPVLLDDLLDETAR
jgi:predicted dehydrogenase